MGRAALLQEGSSGVGSMKLRSLSILIPAYNDHATIERVLDEAQAVGRRVAQEVEIVVVDDGSTIPVVVPRSVRLIRHATNRGYGATIKELYYSGRNEWLFTIPGDYQIGADALYNLLPSCAQADMVIGWRRARNDPANRIVVSWVYHQLLRALFGLRLHDVNSVRLLRRSMLRSIPLASTSAFVDAEFVIRALRSGFRVIEVPISHRPRIGGGSGGGNHWRTILATMRDMLRFLL